MMPREYTRSATIRAGGYVIRGTYHGGPYIDLHFGSDPAAFDVINVWDYATDKPTIRNTPSAVRAALIEWRQGYGDSLAADLREYAFSMAAYR